VFVTSDCHDIEDIALYLPYRWSETLVAGVGVYGGRWPGAAAGAKFLSRAAEIAGISHAISYAGYSVAQEKRTRKVRPSSLNSLLVEGQRGKDERVWGVLLAGHIEKFGAASKEGVFVGGEVDAGSPTRPLLEGSFLFPAPLHRDELIETASALLRLSVTTLGAEYGYCFVRDDAFLPRGYALGISGGSAVIRVREREELDEIVRWSALTRSDCWKLDYPQLRDVYELNLLTARHLGRMIGAQSLGSWIRVARGDRGLLVEVDSHHFLWTLDITQIQRVRST